MVHFFRRASNATRLDHPRRVRVLRRQPRGVVHRALVPAFPPRHSGHDFIFALRPFHHRGAVPPVFLGLQKRYQNRPRVVFFLAQTSPPRVALPNLVETVHHRAQVGAEKSYTGGAGAGNTPCVAHAGVPAGGGAVLHHGHVHHGLHAFDPANRGFRHRALFGFGSDRATVLLLSDVKTEPRGPPSGYARVSNAENVSSSPTR
mmetsp:Transcript_1801/g.6111  ORF Transcript_1801/g.6111 Transcript_1801/m.6111 type:complete len:203 (+) Transcript_1801:44-652(+)